jgi:hypothetical protein
VARPALRIPMFTMPLVQPSKANRITPTNQGDTTNYSARKASTGSTVAARREGK